MNISLFFETKNVTPQVKEKVNTNTSENKFKNILSSIDSSANSSNRKMSVEQKDPDLPNLSDILDEVNEFLQDSNLRLVDSNNISEENQDEFILDLLSKLKEVLNSDIAFNELSNENLDIPLGVNLLLIVSKMNNFTEIDSPIKKGILSKLNQLLESEFSSYNSPPNNNTKDLMNSLNAMNVDDKALLEGQLQFILGNKHLKEETRYYHSLLSDMPDKSLKNSMKTIVEEFLPKENSTKNLEKILLSEDKNKIQHLLDKLLMNEHKMEDTLPNNQLLSQKQIIDNKGSSKLLDQTISLNLESLSPKYQQINSEGEVNSAKSEFTNKLLEILKESRLSQLNNGSGRMIVKLTPEHLGSITIKLVKHNGTMTAQIIANSQSAKELLEFSSSQLKQSLPNINIEIDRFDVYTEDKSQLFKQYKENKENKENKEDDQQDQVYSDEEDREGNFKETLLDALNIMV
ncbi:flagellar hook-length control protein FliK [Metabacillus crassostreae]|uniref:flagellar hook-length control protein FliK n=1 Tax=Metabacillus crassostreae TaxID=929098 RepID=UPI00195C6DF2|nr:flagellar hook-length control protein FliK [Metabacillus crassostreae]MBM7603318.1 flagellar hook-length control protein FliK [Metabacillus crassostreae]